MNRTAMLMTFGLIGVIGAVVWMERRPDTPGHGTAPAAAVQPRSPFRAAFHNRMLEEIEAIDGKLAELSRRDDLMTRVTKLKHDLNRARTDLDGMMQAEDPTYVLSQATLERELSSLRERIAAAAVLSD